MTPAEVKKAVNDMNASIRATELQLREEVGKWFVSRKQTIFASINTELLNKTFYKTDPAEEVGFSVPAADYKNKMLWSEPYNNMKYDLAVHVINDETQKQCELIGEFIKAQGHNLTKVKATYKIDFGIADIGCNFTIATPSTSDKTRDIHRLCNGMVQKTWIDNLAMELLC